MPYMLSSLLRHTLFSLKSPYIRHALETDCASEIIKNGENSVPPMRLAAIAFITESSKNGGNGISNAIRMAAFPSPSRKNGTILGKSSSA